MRLGVMGGTFDPIHHGHLVAASEVQSRFDLDEVVFVPTGQPWQKADRHVSPAEDRYLMTVIASAPSERQVGAIVDEVEDRLRELGTKPIRREGEREGRWVLIDFGDIIVHVQHEEEREYYALERLWKDCPEIDLEAVQAPARPGADAADAGDEAVEVDEA